MRLFWIMVFFLCASAQASPLDHVRLLRTFQGEAWVNEWTQVSSDGRFVAGVETKKWLRAGDDYFGDFIVYDLLKDKMKLRIPSELLFSGSNPWFKFDYSGRFLLTPSKNLATLVRIWDLHSEINSSQFVNSVEPSRYGEFFDGQGTPQTKDSRFRGFWLENLYNNQEKFSWINHGGLSQEIAILDTKNLPQKHSHFGISPDASRVFAVYQKPKGAVYEYVVAVWKLGTKSPVQPFVFSVSNDSINDIISTSDSRFLLTLSLKGNIQIWDADTGQLTARLTDPKNSLQRAHILGQKLVLSPKDQWLFSIEESETRAWDWRTNQLIKKWKFDTKPIFTPDGQTMIHSNSGDVIVSSLRDLHEVKRLKGHLLRAYPQGISLDSKKLVTKSSDGTLKYWDLTKGVLSRNYGAYTHTVVSDDGLTVGLARGDGLLRITETFSSRLLTVIQIGSDYGSKELVLSPHGRYFAYAEITYWHGISDIAILGSRLRVWNTHTGSLLWKKEGVPASRIVFSTNGFTFAGIAQLGANRDFVAFKAFTQTGKIKPLPLPEAKKFREPNTDTVQFIGLHFRQNHFSLVIFVQGRVNQNTDGSGGKTTTRAYLWNLEHSQLEKNIFGNQLCLQIREHTHDEDMLCTLDQFSFTKTQAITWDISKSTWAAKSTSSHFSVLQAVPNGEGYDRTEFFLVETILRHNKWILLRVKKLDLILSEEDSPYISWNRKIWFTKDGRFLISSQSNAVQVYGSIQAGHIFK